MVADSKRDTISVIATPSTITAVKSSADRREESAPAPTKNMVRMLIRIGNLPLQGTKQLVKMAIIRSRGESIIRQPTTPAALHPNPIHMVSACLPQAHAF